MSKPAHYVLDIYGTSLHAAFDRKAWKQLRDENPGLQKCRTLGAGLTHYDLDRDGTQHLWIWVDANAHHYKWSLLNTIAHEATHAAAFICERHEIDLNASRSEPLAYLSGWIAEWLWKNRP